MMIMKYSLDSNIMWDFKCIIPKIVDDIIANSTHNSKIYFKSHFNEYTYQSEDELPLCKSYISIYLSKEDLKKDKAFIEIETGSYGTGGVYSFSSVYSCNLQDRYNKFIFNEIKEYFNLKVRNMLNIVRNNITNRPQDDMVKLMNLNSVDFILLPYIEEENDRLFLNYRE